MSCLRAVCFLLALVGSSGVKVGLGSPKNEQQIVEQPTQQSAVATLSDAVIDGDAELVDQLLHFASDDELSRAIFLASYLGNTDVLQVLLSAGISVDFFKDFLMTPLMIAAKKGHLPVVTMLIANGFMSCADWISDAGTTALDMAAKNGHADVVQQLLEEGAGTEIGERHTPLQTAALYGRKDVVELLLDYSANTEATTQQRGRGGETPLMLAASKGHFGVVELLLAAGAGQRTPAADAAWNNGHHDLARFIYSLSPHASFNAPRVVDRRAIANLTNALRPQGDRRAA